MTSSGRWRINNDEFRGDEGWRMTDFRNNKKLYEMYLDRLKLDYEKAKEMNDKITILRKR